MNPTKASISTFEMEGYVVLNYFLPIATLTAAFVSFVAVGLYEPMLLLLAKDMADKFEMLGEIVSASVSVKHHFQEQIQVIRYEMGPHNNESGANQGQSSLLPVVQVNNWTAEEDSTDQVCNDHPQISIE